MAEQNWPSVEYVCEYNLISSISELKEDEVYAIVDYHVQVVKTRPVGIVTVLGQDMKERKIWSVTMIDNMITSFKLPRLLCYKGLKACKGGKKMHLLNFAPIPENCKWIKEYCEKRKEKVSFYNIFDAELI